MTFNATVDPTFAGATIRNEAVQSAGTTYNPAPMAEAFVTVGSGLNLAIAATKDPAVYSPKEMVTFKVTAENRTNYPMAAAAVTIQLPTGLSWNAGAVQDADGGTVVCTGNSCIWTLPAPLNAKTSVTLTIQAVADGTAGQQMTVTATQTMGSTLKTIPTASTVVKMAAASSATFNACHNFVTSHCSRAAGRLYTRVVGTAFSTDVVVLRSDDTIYSDYAAAGGADKKVSVQLFDPVTNQAVETKEATFRAGDTSGRVTVSWSVLNTAYKELQVRITGSNGATQVTVVSSDSFAMRPSAVTITTDASANLPDTTTPRPTPVIKAGTAFTMRASTEPTASYKGALALDTTKLSVGTGLVQGKLNKAGTTNLLVLQANDSASDNATYDEVGYLNAAAGAFHDNSFTAIDQNAPAKCDPAADCDCISAATATTPNAPYLDALVDSTGRVGCYIGNAQDISFGRFIPDHFTVSAVLTNRSELTGCTPSFTYMGERMRLALTLTARNAGGGTTQNYNSASGFAGLNGAVTENWNGEGRFGTIGSIGLGAVDGTVPATALSERLGLSNLASGWTAGVGALAADVVFSRAANPDGPFEKLQLGVAPRDLDGVALLPSALDLDADLVTPITKERQLIATTGVRYGRLRLSNAHGSELLPLSVPLRLEYFKAGTGFVATADDTCSGTKNPVANTNMDDFAVGDLKITNPRVNMTVTASTPSFVRKPSPGSVLSDIRLTAPGVGRNGSIDLELDVPAWLEFAWNGAAAGPRNPRARATFGVYRGNNNFIYMRENY